MVLLVLEYNDIGQIKMRDKALSFRAALQNVGWMVTLFLPINTIPINKCVRNAKK